MLEMINDGKDLREEKPNPRTLSQGRKPGTPATSQGKKIHVQPSRDGHRRTDTSWQAEQVSLNHHILILHLHLVKLLSTPFVFFAFTIYDIKIYIDLLPRIPFYLIFCLNFHLGQNSKGDFLHGCQCFIDFSHKPSQLFLYRLEVFVF